MERLRARLVQLHESFEVQYNVMQWMVMQYLLPYVCMVSLKSDEIAIIIKYKKLCNCHFAPFLKKSCVLFYFVLA